MLPLSVPDRPHHSARFPCEQQHTLHIEPFSARRLNYACRAPSDVRSRWPPEKTLQDMNRLHRANTLTGGSTIPSLVRVARSISQRTLLVAVFAVTLALVAIDFTTWVELDVAAVFGLPLLLVGPTRSRRLLWMLTAVLVITTFAAYAVQIPKGAFSLTETFFVNRMLDVVELLLIAGLLHIRMIAADKSDSQAQVIAHQNEKLEAAKISRRLVEVQESERRTLANALHDLVGQKLTALNINLNIVKSESACVMTAQSGARLGDSLKLVEETIESIRDVMAELRPAVLDDYGLTAALRWYAEQFSKRTGVATTVIEQGPGRLPVAAEEALFRIVQEALTNVAKYARATHATVTLGVTAQASCLTIADDGCGFDSTAPEQPARDRGWGLMIMRERAAAVGAELKVESAPGQGTRIIITLRNRAS
jgi:signal transduction histidine kinase